MELFHTHILSLTALAPLHIGGREGEILATEYITFGVG